MDNAFSASKGTDLLLDAAGQIGFNMPLFFEAHTGPQYPTQQNNVGNTCGSVAQLVEQWTENPRVGSSILPRTTTLSFS